MTWLHPGILFSALALATAPVVIHLIHRRQMPREPWAAMQWLRAAHDASSRRLRVQHWLLMVSRIAMLLLLGATVARPLVGSAAWPAGWGTARVNRVIVIDDSLSMLAIDKTASDERHEAPSHSHAGAPRSLFEEARRAALSIVDSSGGGDGLAVVTASSMGRAWMSQPVHDRHAVRTLIEELTGSYGMNDPVAALRRADEVLDGVRDAPADREIYYLTDLTRGAWPDSLDLHPSDRLTLVPVSRQDLPNVAVTDFRAVTQTVGRRIATRFAVEVVNYASQPLREAIVDLLLDGRRVTSVRLGPIDAGGRAEGECEVELPRHGACRLTAWLRHEDALPVDDTRHLVVRAPAPTRVLLVDDHAREPRVAQDLFYYAAAVTSAEASDEPATIETHTIDPAELDETAVSDYSLIVLGNPSRLSAEHWRRLHSYVEAGGGLMVFLGDRLHAEDYNARILRPHASAGLAPMPLKDRIVFAPDADLPRLVLADPSHVVTADIARHERGGLSSSLVRGYWQTQEAQANPSVRTLLRLSSGAPVLTLHPLGRGRVATWFFGPTLEDCNLPARPDYMPLMLSLTSYLICGDSTAIQHAVGDVLEVELTEAAGEPITVLRPDGVGELAETLLRDDRRVGRYSHTNLPGYYGLRGEDGLWEVAVNIGAEDSDLRRLDPRALVSQGGPNVTVLEPRPRHLAGALQPPHELATLVGALLLGVVVLETLLASRFGRSR